jgi:hypothetical protein
MLGQTLRKLLLRNKLIFNINKSFNIDKARLVFKY